MLDAYIDGELEKRPPRKKGERTFCRTCGDVLSAVMSSEKLPHWRHQKGDCDSWSEPETEWHSNWKMRFPANEREVTFKCPDIDEFHRADVFCRGDSEKGTVIELQHSGIALDKITEREEFYQREHKMFWLVHLYNKEGSFHKTSFIRSLNDGPISSNEIILSGHTFRKFIWFGRNSQFIEKWKRSTAHVFFECDDRIYYLATRRACQVLLDRLGKGEFAICELSRDRFIYSARFGAGSGKRD